MTKLSQRLQDLHKTLREQQPHLTRVAVALYDDATGLVTTYAYSSDIKSPLLHYSASLQEVPSLQQLAVRGQARLVQDLTTFAEHPSEHTRALIKAGYRSSLTVPMHNNDQLLGFVFFNADQPNCFSRFQIPQLEIAAYAISLLIVQERTEVNTLQATMKSAIEVTHERNPETGEHLKRIAGFTRLIACEVATHFNLDDEFIEHLVQFSAMHDIGKISVPDQILLKPGKLTADEFEVMKTHTSRGRTLVDHLIRNHALESLDYIAMLRNIIELHHENWDGSGYPHGISGDEIPVEARIVATADVYDALTSERPYKDRLSTDQAVELMLAMRGVKLDPHCVDAFIKRLEDAELIRSRFAPDEHAELPPTDRDRR
ncbi:HD domain-containing phosphohydrolase [Motiliproteus sediminis]|uniref:HD domain-containing phosphohydrolase n=1 Tax=Motiliproteus sediminis TaxID=1468178 RepID=UPI001AEF8043|nr:HD domain-containing phosphohydrolase [Motiliproteus sediminis]